VCVPTRFKIKSQTYWLQNANSPVRLSGLSIQVNPKRAQ